MEHQKGLSNDTDSRTSNTSSTRDQESTGFSATPDDPLSSSVFSHDRLDAQLDLDSELDIAIRSQTTSLWSQSTPLHDCLPPEYQRQRIVMQQARDNYEANCTNFTLPLDNIYNPLFQYRMGAPASLQGSAPGPTSPRVMASKLLDMHGYVQSGCSRSTPVESEVSPPAGKKMRSMRVPPIGKHEYPSQEPYSFHQNKALAAPGNTPHHFAEMDRQPWQCPSEDKGRPGGVRHQMGSTVMGTRELSTMEQLLVQCATALEASDITYAQQTIFVINNIAAVDGDPNQRLLAYFLRALILRASKFAPHLLPGDSGGSIRSCKLKTVLELTNYIDVMPWYRFGFIAANGAMLEAFEGKEKVHILDFNISHCMQWPTLIEALAERSEGPPQVRLTVCVSRAPIPPLLEVPYDDLIMRLAKFARSKNVPFEYELLVEDLENLHPSRIGVREGEILAVNCLFRLHYVSDEAHSTDHRSTSPRDELLRLIRHLNPAIVTLTEEDANLTPQKLVPRLRAAFNYLWIPFDALHTLLPGESQQRRHCEDEVANKIENLVACEGGYRIERVETKDRWVQRMRRARFEMVSFSEDVVAENKLMLGEHSGCWGLRKDEDEEVLFLTWKGHNVSFATAWVPVDQVHLPL